MAGYPGNSSEDQHAERRWELFLENLEKGDNEALNLIHLDIKKVLKDLEESRDIERTIKFLKILTSSGFHTINDIDKFIF